MQHSGIRVHNKSDSDYKEEVNSGENGQSLQPQNNQKFLLNQSWPSKKFDAALHQRQNQYLAKSSNNFFPIPTQEISHSACFSRRLDASRFEMSRKFAKSPVRSAAESIA